MARPILESIQAGRGIAALMIVFVHAEVTFLGRIWGAGVDFFFVLSGFIIFYVHHQDFGHHKKIGRYLYRRIVRIYPVYWCIIAGYLGLHLLLGNDLRDFYQSNTQGLIKTIFLLPAHPLVVLTSWTLAYELIFYLVVVLRFVFKFRIVFYSFFVFPFLGIWGWYVLPISKEFYHHFFIEALLGTFVFSFYQKRSINFLVIYSLFFGGLFLLGFAAYYSPIQNPLLIRGIPCFMILLALVGWEKKQKIKIPRFFLVLGNASYVLYLTHTIFLSLLTALIIDSQGFVPTWVMLWIRIGITITLAIVVHYCLEKPLLKFLRKLGKQA
ncbi:MAG TPA: hypothetical protein DCS93_00270 [Microscillaceae bacterium]|nr:hypothetical protein [Microscillaceae bacterium]